MAALPDAVSAAILADLLGLDERTVRKLATENIVVRASGRGRYELAASVRAYINRLREQAAGRLGSDEDIDPATENALLRREQRENYRLKNGILAKTSVEVARIEPAWGRVVRAVRSAMLAVPAKLGLRLPHLSAYDRQVVEEVIREQLTDAALAEDPPQHDD